MNTLLEILLLAVAGIVYASQCEWMLHRYIMHRPILRFFRYPFEAHALTHHTIFKANDTYHLVNDHDKKTIPMAWWNGPLIVLIGSVPFLVFALLLRSTLVYLVPTLACGAYYLAYEWIHWCMHLPLPKRRIIERNWIFYRLNGHHLLHHRYMHKNFNVVLPVADLMYRTLMLRSPVKFAQARGISVPDVQPRS